MEHLDAETAMTEQAKAERSRAEERMTLRHKNTSKWAKRLLQRGSLDPQVCCVCRVASMQLKS